MVQARPMGESRERATDASFDSVSMACRDENEKLWRLVQI